MAETAEEVKTEKVFDIGQGKYVEKPVEEKKEEEPKDEEEEEEPKKEEKKEETPPPTDYTKYLKDKFGADSEDALAERLGKLESLEKELEEAKKKPSEYEFKSEKEKAIAGFLKDWDLDNMDQGVEFATKLMKIEPEKMEAKAALRERYVLENSEIDRDKAVKMFESEYKKLYELKKDDFDTDEDFKEAQELADIKKEKESIRAKKLLAEKKESLKYKEPKKEDKKEEKLEPRITQEHIAPYQKQIDTFFKPKEGEDFDRFIFQDDDETIPPITLVIPPDKLKNIKQTVSDYLKMEGNYDKDKKIPNFDPQRLVKQVFDALYGDWKDEQMLKEVVRLAKVLKAEQLGGIKPTKKSAGQGKEGTLSIEEQFQKLAEKEKEQRQKKR